MMRFQTRKSQRKVIRLESGSNFMGIRVWSSSGEVPMPLCISKIRRSASTDSNHEFSDSLPFHSLCLTEEGKTIVNTKYNTGIYSLVLEQALSIEHPSTFSTPATSFPVN
jgi:hypothetical protein